MLAGSREEPATALLSISCTGERIADQNLTYSYGEG